MTENTVREIVRRAVSDAAFRGQLRSDPATALAGIGITAEERSALTSGDPARLTALGVDQRMSKAFTVGFASEASKAVIGDPQINDPVFYSDETTGAKSAVTDDQVAGSAAAAVESPFGSAADYHLRMTEGTIDTSSALAPEYGSTADHMLHTTEGNIDTGAVVDPSADVQLSGDASVTEY